MAEPGVAPVTGADLRAEVAAYDRRAEVGTWPGPRHRMTYRALGQGPPLVVCPGVGSTYRGYAMLMNRLAARFRTVVLDYPGEHPDDGARLARIGHEDLVDDLLGLADHLGLGRSYLFGPSFGSTVVLRALHREPGRFPRAVLQGGFARRRFAPAERLALLMGRLVPGDVRRLPFHGPALAWKNRAHFVGEAAGRWAYYLEQNGLTPIAPLSHRLDLLARLDLRPILAEVRPEVLLLQGDEDRIVPRPHFDELRAGLPRATAVLMPRVGHVPHFTHVEALAGAIEEFLGADSPGGS